MQSTSYIAMIRPVNFGYNEQTASSNAFQSKPEIQTTVQDEALKEFDQLVEKLQKEGINVSVFSDTITPPTPDSIFPNNWISTHHDGTIFLYPMQAENRRQERRADLLERLQLDFEVSKIVDLSFFEKEEKFLEGTGSMVLDRQHHIAYACISPRTDPEVLRQFCQLANYQCVTFNATDSQGKPIYHTNVMMCMGENFCTICLDSITDFDERTTVMESFLSTGKEVVQITREQMNCFAGNMLQLKNTQGEDLLIMSSSAYQSLSRPQKQQLEKFCRIVSSDLHTIEKIGGGSARCMIAEIHLPKK